MVQVVILSANGDKKSVNAKTTGDVTAAVAAKILRKTKAALIGAYPHGEDTLQVWGVKEGKAGNENKHELPPPFDTELLFGDLVVTALSSELVTQDLTVETWDEFYQEAFGFEDLESEEEDAEDVEDAVDEDEEEEEEEVEEADEVAEDEEAEAEEAEESEVDADDDCYDDGEEAGGGSKRRAPRRKTAASTEYRRIDMGLKARIKLPGIVGKRAPRWQTDEELTEETY